MKKLLTPTLIILAVFLLQTVPVGWAWQIERPHMNIAVQDRVESAYTNGEVSVGLGAATYNYIEGPDPHYGDSDFLSMNMSMTANSRVGISYKYVIGGLWWVDEGSLYSRNYLSLADDNGTWVNIPEGVFRFYGGQYSAEYQKVWVCSNGFVAFDEKEYARAPTQYRSPASPGIPYGEAPNAIIAAVWTDLQPDGRTRIFTGVYKPDYGMTYFVVTWENIKHKASGQRLTFQIILRNAWDYRSLIQSAIYISYINVKAINTKFAWGIEDQQGLKGLGGLYDGANLKNFNGKTITFTQNSSSFYLKRLTITLQDTCTQTRFNILEPQDYPWSHLRGYNILPYGNLEPDPTQAFAKALGGTATLLIGSLGGFIVGGAFIVMELVGDLAESQYGNRAVDVYDYADAQTNWAEAYAYTWVCVDASLSISVDWILDDANNQEHSLTITAKAEYRDLTNPDNPVDKPPVTTTVNLKITLDDNNDWISADPIVEGTYPWLYVDSTYDPVDLYKIWVVRGQGIYATMTIGPPPKRDFNLYLYDPYRTLKASSELGTGYTESISFIADSSGYWYIKVTPVSAEGFYSLTVDITSPPGTEITRTSGSLLGTGDSYTFFNCLILREPTPW